jgi:hypothetical protein
VWQLDLGTWSQSWTEAFQVVGVVTAVNLLSFYSSLWNQLGNESYQRGEDVLFLRGRLVDETCFALLVTV